MPEHVLADRLKKVGLAEAHASVDEERVVLRAGGLGGRQRRRVGEAVRRPDDERVEGVLVDQGRRQQDRRRRSRLRRMAENWSRASGRPSRPRRPTDLARPSVAAD